MNRKRLKIFLLAFSITAASFSIEASQVVTQDSLKGKAFDVVIAGGTPGGLATAIRASREGLSVLLVNHTAHIGGMLTNGLGVLDTEYYRARSPIYDEMCARLVSHYEGKTFDEDSFERFDVGERLYYEPHVIENILNEMVAVEEISILLDHYPARIIKDGTTIESVRFQHMDDGFSVLVRGRYFVDAMYEADLAALAGVPYRVGRESRAEYGEPHAGVSFTHLVDSEERPEAIKDLRVHVFRLSSREIPHPQNGEGDNAIQAYNFRLALSRDPVNRYIPPKPDNYDPEVYQIIKERLRSLPKAEGRFGWKVTGWNTPILPGGNHDYPNASWPERKKIAQRHLDWAIGILHYLQRDLPEPVWGLAKDEFVDNNYAPYEMYVREARRIKGLKVFTELDGVLSKDFDRAPIQADSIAITEWALDSHACTTDRFQNSRPEGKVLLAEETVPGQVDFKTLISEEATNLVVPVCLSTTHIGWGTIRLEPTWM
ncbi:MAG: FAD-dependent oxidoreductase, partial [Opitutae bacterium]|nr:FAD-dependent oxidoreductase [Opitutae bacterium]